MSFAGHSSFVEAGDFRRPLILPMRRVQRSRRKGARLPEGAICVTRPTLWGNPFDQRHGGHARCTIYHRQWLNGRIGDLTLERMGFCGAEIEALHRKRERILLQLHTLAGHDLACWCPLTSEWCHADTYLALAPIYAEYAGLSK